MPHPMITLLARLCLGLVAAGSLFAAAPRIENSTVVLDGTFAFKAGTAELTAESNATATQLAAFLREKTTFTRVRIEGPGSARSLGQTELGNGSEVIPGPIGLQP